MEGQARPEPNSPEPGLYAELQPRVKPHCWLGRDRSYMLDMCSQRGLCLLAEFWHTCLDKTSGIHLFVGKRVTSFYKYM